MAYPVIGSCFLIGSNLFMIPAIVFSYNISYYYVYINLVVSMVVSILYHMCDSTGACLGNASISTWRTTDHIFANIAISMMFIILMRFDRSSVIYRTKNSDNEIIEDKEINYVYEEYEGGGIIHRHKKRGSGDNTLYLDIKSKKWAEIMRNLYTATIIVYVIIRPNDDTITALVILIGIFCLYTKSILLTDYRENIFTQFDYQSLIVGLAMGTVSIIFYLLDNFENLYWLWHSLWHCLGFLALYYIQMGMTKTTNNWHGIFYCCTTIKDGLVDMNKV